MDEGFPKGGGRQWLLMGPGLLFGVMKSSKIDCGYVLHNCVNRLKTMHFELMVHFEWIIWYVSYVLIKPFFKKSRCRTVYKAHIAFLKEGHFSVWFGVHVENTWVGDPVAQKAATFHSLCEPHWAYRRTAVIRTMEGKCAHLRFQMTRAFSSSVKDGALFAAPGMAQCLV